MASSTNRVIVVTGASSGLGALTARHLADAGHTVYAGMHSHTNNHQPAAEAVRAYAKEHKVDMRLVHLDILDDACITAAVDEIYSATGRLDVIVHNAGHMSHGPAEAFTPEQFMRLYEINVVGAQRLNRIALPRMRKARSGFLVWISSSSARGGGSPYLSPYFAAKAAMDSLAQSYASELSQWGIDTTIVVPGIFTSGTNHFANAGNPADEAVAAEYENGPTKGLMEQNMKGPMAIEPPTADVTEVAREIVRVVGLRRGETPFRIHIDPTGQWNGG